MKWDAGTWHSHLRIVGLCCRHHDQENTRRTLPRCSFASLNRSVDPNLHQAIYLSSVRARIHLFDRSFRINGSKHICCGGFLCSYHSSTRAPAWPALQAWDWILPPMLNALSWSAIILSPNNRDNWFPCSQPHCQRLASIRTRLNWRTRRDNHDCS